MKWTTCLALFFLVLLSPLRFASCAVSISCVLVCPLFSLSSVQVSLCFLYHLLWCPFLCCASSVSPCSSIIRHGVPVVPSSVLVPPLFSLSFGLVPCRFSLSSVLVCPLVYYLSWCHVYSIVCPGVRPTGLWSVLMSHLSMICPVVTSAPSYHLSRYRFCPLC